MVEPLHDSLVVYLVMENMRTLVTTLLFLVLTMNTAAQSSVHEFTISSLDGGEIAISDFKGKKILIVNTASECGYTSQYEQLQELHESMGDKLVIIGVPANDFGGQEPGTHAEIATFCQKNYGVTFPLTEKLSVKGDDQHAMFTWLCAQENPDFTGDIKWNFEKFMLDENGKLIRRFRSGTSPLDEEIVGQL